MSADSTGVEPPTSPHPVNLSPSSARKRSIFQKLKITSLPPIVIDTQAQRRNKHSRSNSFGGLVSRVLPSHREEKGYTLREQYDKNSSQDPVELIFGLPGLRRRDGESAGLDIDGGSESGRPFSDNSIDFICPDCLFGIAGPKHSTISRVLDGRRHSGGHDGGTIPGDRPGGDNGARGVTHDRSYTASWGRRFGLRRDIKDEDPVYTPDDRRRSNSPLLGIEKESPESKTQKIFDDKKARREQRRSLRESGDFLGVQGANPRTGFWDVSSGTSSSGPSQMSSETKKKLDDDAKKIEDQKKRYEEAKAKHEAELTRVQILRDNKKLEKEKQKNMELKMKQRRHGRWKLSEEGWHSLAEPDLSPITQSVAGSPGKGMFKTAPDDRLFPMPTGDDPTPYTNPHNIGPQDYFGHRLVSSPLIKERLSAQMASPESSRRSTSIPRKPVGSPTRRNEHDTAITCLQQKSVGSKSRRNVDESTTTIVHTASSVDPIQNEYSKEEISRPVEDKRSPVEHELRKERELRSPPQHIPGSRNGIPRLDITLDSQRLGKSFLEAASVSQKFDSFLGKTLDQCFDESSRDPPTIGPKPRGYQPGEALQFSQRASPVNIRDPFAARIPSKFRAMASNIWAPPTILSSSRRLTPRIITIPTTITTGSAQLLPLHVQFDNQRDQRRHVRGRCRSLQRKLSQIPLRTSSLPNSKQPALQSTRSQIDSADIAISSEHLLVATKQRTAESCHTSSPGGEKVVVKTTPISISTSQPTHEMVSPAARIAILASFQNLRHRTPTIKAEAQGKEDYLTPPKLRIPVVEVENISTKAKVAQGGPAGTEDPLKTKSPDDEVDRPTMNVANAIPVKTTGWEDSLVVWHPSPKAENRKASPVPPGPPSSSPSPTSGSASSSPRRKLTSDEKYGIIRRGNGSSSIVIGGGPPAGQTYPSSTKAQLQQDSSPRVSSCVLTARLPSTNCSDTQPTAETKAKDNKQLVVQVKKKKGSSSGKRGPPTSATPQMPSMQDVSTIGMQMVHSAWCFVEPVFDAKSDVRRRWNAGHLTLRDIIMFTAAAGFVGFLLLIMLLGLRILLMGLHIGRGFWTVFRVLTGF
ncbi:hypothetical protein D0Z07_4196 [Hyphodiscus hymeniophilus]|uniref:Uncharacterized protein n=1 Tax=Hyphodiscus hymeniophilus TaxID=353542 RepID=A0A9P6VJL3_9HELO|nr:hypothetical protein D0Z07_4196 [Hyphodiscus hymeniophilus]